MRLTILAVMAALLMAPALCAQKVAPKDGDLIPRAGTLAYAVSDRPEALLHLFGRDASGKWRIRGFLEGKLEEEFATDPDGEEARRARSILEYVSNSYEAIQRAELGLLDVTLDGPKYVLLLHAKSGRKIDIAPAFLAEYLAETREFQGVKYLEYRGPDATEPADEGSERREDEAHRPAVKMGMDRFYVAAMPDGVMIANFESSIRESIQRLVSGDYSESLSGRAEFQEWKATHKPHDLSFFLVGRELQNAIERVLPSKDQSGVDAQGVYRGIDDWLQLREYRYVVFDLDYDESARAFTIAAAFKTRRQTRLLEKLAIEPADFKLLKYVPTGAVMSMGVQLGDARKTFENLKELSYDVEGWYEEVMKGFGRAVPPDFPDEPPPDEGIEPKSVLPGITLAELLQLAGEGEGSGDTGDKESEIDRMLAKLDEALAEYGTTVDEILSALGTELIVHLTPDLERAKARVWGTPDMGDVLASGTLGVVIGLKDTDKARQIIAAAREKDPRGAFRGFESLDYQGRTLMLSAEHPFGWCFTDNALVLTIVLGLQDQDATAPVLSGITAMIDASRKTGSGGAFVANGSKFLEVDVGALSRLENQLADHQSHKLDRYAQPPLESSPTRFMDGMTVALRLREHKDGVEIALRVAGMPDLWQFINGEASMIGGAGSARRNGYNYGEENLRNLSRVLRERAEAEQSVDLDEMVKAGVIRGAALQLPFDKRWKGELETLGWITLDQVTRDKDGNLPEWVDAKAAEMIETNEKAAWRSLKLIDGNVAELVRKYKTGYVIAYQESADTLEGHMVLYADGQVGWLGANAFKEALKLNAEGKPVPAEENWHDSTAPVDSGERLPPDDPWNPMGK